MRRDIKKTSSTQETKMTIFDPVCGMKVDPKTAKGGASEYRGQHYYFCNPKCKIKFDNEPQIYLLPKPEHPQYFSNVEYTCPMHPEIKQLGPGSCPICGMALEPTILTSDDQEDQTEYLDMRRRLIFSVILSAPLLFVSMGGRHLIASQKIQTWMSVVFT